MRRSGLGGRGADRSTHVAALFLSAFTAQASVLALSPLLPKIAEALGGSVGDVGQLRTISGGVACFTALALGRWPTVRLRNLIAGGVALLALGSLAGALAPTLTALRLAQVPIGVGLAAVLVGAVAAAGEWPSVERRTRVLAWTLVGQPVAWVVGMPVVGTIAAAAGWRPALVALPVSASVPALMALRRAPAGRGAARSGDRRWLLHPPVARWALGEVLAFSAWSATLVYAGALFAASYGAGPAQVGLVLGVGAAAYLPGNFAARPWVERSARTAAGALALLAGVVVLALFAARPSLGISAALFAAMAAIGGARTLAGSARGLELGGSRPVVSTGVRAAALQLGYLVGAGLGGAVLDARGPSALGVALSAMFGAAGAISLLRARNEGPSSDRAARPSPPGSPDVFPVPLTPSPNVASPFERATASRGGQGVGRHRRPVTCGTEPAPRPSSGRPCREEGGCDGYRRDRAGDPDRAGPRAPRGPGPATLAAGPRTRAEPVTAVDVPDGIAPVEGWGRVVVGRRGWRAAFARPIELYALPSWGEATAQHIERLARGWGIPLRRWDAHGEGDEDAAGIRPGCTGGAAAERPRDGRGW